MEAGTIDQMVEDQEQAPEPDDKLEELYVEGTSGQMSLKVGGRSPDTATVKLQGGSINLEGEFDKGEEVTLVITARIAEIAFVDKMDPAGFVKSTERRHIARMEGVRRA